MCDFFTKNPNLKKKTFLGGRGVGEGTVGLFLGGGGGVGARVSDFKQRIQILKKKKRKKNFFWGVGCGGEGGEGRRLELVIFLSTISNLKYKKGCGLVSGGWS